MSSEEIYNYRKVNDHLITGGQPTEDQLKSRRRGIQRRHQPGGPQFTTLVGGRGQPGPFARHGLLSHPVAWDNPQESDFDTFEDVVKHLPAGKTLIHCAPTFASLPFIRSTRSSIWMVARPGRCVQSVHLARQQLPGLDGFIRHMMAASCSDRETLKGMAELPP